MALTLVVRSGDGPVGPRITFDSPRVVIGRGDGCEVRLPDPSVSHRHASIRQRGSEYIVMDEGSTNGTFVGPVRLSPQAPRVIRSGDLIRVGRVWLEARMEHAMPTEDASAATRELALALVASALAADGDPSEVRVRVLEGPATGAELVLAGFDRAHVVGRLAGADLFIDDPDLSRRHLELTRRGDRLVVRDLGSKNGTLLAGQRLPANEEIPWPRAATLELGRSKLAYDDPVAEALLTLETAADERLRESDVIAPPGGPPAPAEARPAPREPLPSKRPREPAPRPAQWTLTDALVVFVGLLVIVLSAAGLVWLMRSG